MIEIKDIVTWLKNWFYDKNEVYAKTETMSSTAITNALGDKVNVAQGSGNADKNVCTNSSGNITTENKVTAGSGLSLSNTNQMSHSNSVTGGALTTATLKKIKYDAQGHLTETSNATASDLVDGSASGYTAISSNLTNASTQADINSALNSVISNLKGTNFIVVDTSKPVASADTMGKMYIISENNEVNVYYTKSTTTGGTTTYSWEMMDSNILDNLTTTGVKNSATLSNIGSSLTNQALINSAINDKFANMLSKLEIVSSMPSLSNVDDGYMCILQTSNSFLIKYASKPSENQQNTWKWISFYDAGSISALLAEKSDKITSYLLVPKGSVVGSDESKGIIRLYQGDEPT